ncbi:MAG: sugar phosphate isomerase/epimerase [Oscillospiraceae bacterium]|nr:sugar phosphate isomerase/epimerase [Oscillospiraceae bacterium]
MINVFYEHIAEGCIQRGITVEEGLRTARSYGIEGLECDLWRLTDRILKTVLDDNGMQVRSVYHMFDTKGEPVDTIKGDLLSLLDTAAFYGADKVLIVPGLDMDREYAARMLSVICASAEGYGIKAMIEDYDDIRSPCCRSDDIAYLLERAPSLGFAFDTGNFAYCGEDELVAFGRFSDRIVHVHLKDRSRIPSGDPKTDVSGRDMWPCAVGDGYIHIREILGKLSSLGYKGDFSIEHFGSNDHFLHMQRSADMLVHGKEQL